jgi:hypothetical protein
MNTPNDSQPTPDTTPLATAAPSLAPGAPEPAESEIAKSEAPKIDAPQIEPPKMPRAEAFKPTFRPRPAVTAAPAKPEASSARSQRFALLAASITIAAALGTAAGALAGAALTRQPSEQPDSNSLRGVVAQLSSEIIALKAAIDTSSKNANAQFAKIAERAEKAQTEPAARLARLAEAIDRLEKKPAIVAAADTTGSIVEKQEQRPPILEGWILRDIFNGRAMVEGRSGLYEVGPGSTLPGVGKVEAVKRQDGRWVVVTGKGLIVSSR